MSYLIQASESVARAPLEGATNENGSLSWRLPSLRKLNKQMLPIRKTDKQKNNNNYIINFALSFLMTIIARRIRKSEEKKSIKEITRRVCICVSFLHSPRK